MTTNSAAAAAATSPQSASAVTKGKDPLADKSTFLKLLVSQIKNQNPLSPTDGTQFLAQLAQFSQVEQLQNISQDLDSIKQSVAARPSSTNSN